MSNYLKGSTELRWLSAETAKELKGLYTTRCRGKTIAQYTSWSAIRLKVLWSWEEYGSLSAFNRLIDLAASAVQLRVRITLRKWKSSSRLRTMIALGQEPCRPSKRVADPDGSFLLGILRCNRKRKYTTTVVLRAPKKVAKLSQSTVRISSHWSRCKCRVNILI